MILEILFIPKEHKLLKGLCSYDHSQFRMDIISRRVCGVKNTLNSEGDEEKKCSSTQTENGERRKRFEVSEYFSVCRMDYVSSLSIQKKSQLIYVKLWKQVIYILDLLYLTSPHLKCVSSNHYAT
jgi:hypothetical protein